ncbi:MAG: hypothetical protein HGB12_16035, partial [Bacteroidetes bacterium]|nr:hypothetical protein [Bacteroidota bacterium]
MFLPFNIRYTYALKCLFISVLLSFLIKSELVAQDLYIEEKPASSFVYDDLPVVVMVEGFGDFNLDVLYTDNDLLYINIAELFKTLNIPRVMGQKGDSLSGFIDQESQTYLIDYSKKQVRVGDKIVNSKNGLVKEMGSLYMESSLFAETFGILLTFNYRALALMLKSDFELPVIKQQRLEKLRNNISMLKGEIVVDTTFKRYYHLFRFGTFDWSLTSFQVLKGKTNSRAVLGLGTELLYGEADASIDYSDQYKFDNRQFKYLWRWVDNDKKIIKQAEVGKISEQTISLLSAPEVGAVIRNSPTTVKKANGYYTINEYTEPNWIVELYINNILVDFTKADPSGLFMFKVPIVYGYTTLKLKFYGPLGEERSEERTMNVPYTIMPTNEFEYSVSGGFLQDSAKSRVGKIDLNYGVSRFLTIGGGLEHLSSITNGPFIPYADATIQPFKSMTINGLYAHGVKSEVLMNYYFLKNSSLNINYIKYVDGQLAIPFKSLEERKLKLSIPFRIKKVSGYYKLDYTQFVYKEFNYNQANTIFSVYYRQFSANSNTQLNWVDKERAYTTSSISLSYRLQNGIIIRPSIMYNVSESKLITYKLAVEKTISNGYCAISYEKNLLIDNYFLNFNFKYDLPLFRTNFTATQSNGSLITSEGA